MKQDLSINVRKNFLGGLMSSEQCQELAKKIMKLYDSDKNQVMEVQDAGLLQSDCYRAMNIEFDPSQDDISSYAKIFDKDGTGKITENDVYALCKKYFGGPLAEQDSVPKEQKSELIELSPITNEESTPKTSKYQPYQSPYRRYSRNSTQVSQTSVPQQQATSTSVVLESAPKIITEPPKYSKLAEARLQVARRIFKMLDTENNGFITEKHVSPLLIETYKNMGMSIEPTREDIDMWMEMADEDRDGKVYLQHYEALVLKSLQKQGIQID